ncbi:hypothetical protein ACM41_12845 [Bradyrhizobium sp. CCBAU 21362]|nr:hypothetical protein [Bradyrhizobium sp. CCBAU 21362]
MDLTGAFKIVKPIVSLSDRLTGDEHSMIAHKQYRFVAKDSCEAFTFANIIDHMIIVIIGDVLHHQDLRLPDRLNTRITETGERTGIGHVGVEHGGRLWIESMDRRVDAERGALNVTLTAQNLAVITHFHKRGGGDLGPMQLERD